MGRLRLRKGSIGLLLGGAVAAFSDVLAMRLSFRIGGKQKGRPRGGLSGAVVDQLAFFSDPLALADDSPSAVSFWSVAISS